MKPEELLELFIKGIRDAVEESGVVVPNEMKNWEMPLHIVRELKKQIGDVEAVSGGENDHT